MDERRRNARQRIFKAGTIEFNRAGGMSCLVRNLSADGVGLEVESPIGIPATFKLLIIGEKTPRNCRIVWRHVKRMGVAFQ